MSKLRVSRTRSRYLFAGLFILVMIALLATGCIGDTDTAQNTLAPEGEVAEKQRDLFMLAMWPALVVMILVEGGIVYMVLRWRRRSNDEMPKQTHGNTPLEIGWTIIPTIIIIAFVGVPMIPVLFELGRDPKADAYPVNVRGERFNWFFEHPELLDANGQPVIEVGELHIPAEEIQIDDRRFIPEIALTLTSIDVIHSFGVPRLAGTRDAIPNRTNTFWIKADHPGSFAGQCRELCGTGHAGMLITVIAQSEQDFENWSQEMVSGQKTRPDSQDAVAAESEE